MTRKIERSWKTLSADRANCFKLQWLCKICYAKSNESSLGSCTWQPSHDDQFEQLHRLGCTLRCSKEYAVFAFEMAADCSLCNGTEAGQTGGVLGPGRQDRASGRVRRARDRDECQGKVLHLEILHAQDAVPPSSVSAPPIFADNTSSFTGAGAEVWKVRSVELRITSFPASTSTGFAKHIPAVALTAFTCLLQHHPVS